MLGQSRTRSGGQFEVDVGKKKGKNGEEMVTKLNNKQKVRKECRRKKKEASSERNRD